MHMFLNKRFLILFFVCVLLLIGVAVVLNSYSAKNQAKREELEGMYESIYEQEMEKIEEREKEREEEARIHAYKEATYSPYQKLADETMFTSVFYLGDRNAYGKGLKDTDNSWKTLLKEKYLTFAGDSHRVEGTLSIERPSGGVFAYLNRLFDTYNSAYGLDLLFLCIGTLDEEQNFGAKYETIIRKAKNQNKNSDAICIIEHNQTDAEAEAILRICEHYELLYVDMRPLFEGRTETLTFEDGYPNEGGHRLYADEIYKTLKNAVDRKRPAKEYKESGVYLTDEEINELNRSRN